LTPTRTNPNRRTQVDKALRGGARAAAITQRLAKAAFEASIDRKRVTPYSRAATEAFDMVYSGGKKVGGGCRGEGADWVGGACAARLARAAGQAALRAPLLAHLPPAAPRSAPRALPLLPPGRHQRRGVPGDVTRSLLPR
jgi:hypothetical protein